MFGFLQKAVSLRFDLDQIKMRWRPLFLHSALTHYLEIIMDDYSSRNHNSETTFFYYLCQGCFSPCFHCRCVKDTSRDPF